MRGQWVGSVGFHYWDKKNRKDTIGYWLAEGFQGKGIMTDAVKALMKYGFETMNLNRIEILCAVENNKSRAIPERLGFKNEGISRENEWLYDHFIDAVAYSLLASEWKKSVVQSSRPTNIPVMVCFLYLIPKFQVFCGRWTNSRIYCNFISEQKPKGGDMYDEHNQSSALRIRHNHSFLPSFGSLQRNSDRGTIRRGRSSDVRDCIYRDENLRWKAKD